MDPLPIKMIPNDLYEISNVLRIQPALLYKDQPALSVKCQDIAVIIGNFPILDQNFFIVTQIDRGGVEFLLLL